MSEALFNHHVIESFQEPERIVWLPISQMKKPWGREVKRLVHGHTPKQVAGTDFEPESDSQFCTSYRSAHCVPIRCGGDGCNHGTTNVSGSLHFPDSQLPRVPRPSGLLGLVHISQEGAFPCAPCQPSVRPWGEHPGASHLIASHIQVTKLGPQRKGQLPEALPLVRGSKGQPQGQDASNEAGG